MIKPTAVTSATEKAWCDNMTEPRTSQQEIDDLDDLYPTNRSPQYKGEDGYWHCGECHQDIIRHLPTCATHNQYREWYRKVCEQNRKFAEEPKPDWMCEGCDQPKEGPHRFGCHSRGIRSTQVVVPVTQNSDGTFTVAPPYSSKP